MAHMRPETWYGGMWLCEAHGDTTYFPDDVFSRDDAARQCGVDPDDVTHEQGWWARLSAPGYTDATDWSGPFKTEKASLDYLYNTYDVDKRGDDRAEAGWEVKDDFDEEEEPKRGPRGGTHGLGETPRRNKKVFNLFQDEHGRWVFRYGATPFRFSTASLEFEELYFSTRQEAVRIATKHGWVVEDNNRLRRAHAGGINGV